VLIHPGKRASVSVKIQNLGNVPAVGTLDLDLNPSADGVTDFSTLLASILNRKIKIAPGKSVILTFGFLDPPSDVGGAFDLVASITSATQPADEDSANDIVSIPTRAPA
jgi:hypothetical protein